MVVLIAQVKLKADRVAEYLSLANAMLAPSRAEEPCITYDFYTKPEDQTQLVFVEEWKSREGLEAHFNMPHFTEFKTKTADLVEKATIRIYAVNSYEDL